MRKYFINGLAVTLLVRTLNLPLFAQENELGKNLIQSIYEENISMFVSCFTSNEDNVYLYENYLDCQKVDYMQYSNDIKRDFIGILEQLKENMIDNKKIAYNGYTVCNTLNFNSSSQILTGEISFYFSYEGKLYELGSICYKINEKWKIIKIDSLKNIPIEDTGITEKIEKIQKMSAEQKRFASIPVAAKPKKEIPGIDSFRVAYHTAGQDTVKINILYELSKELAMKNPEQSLQYSQKALDISEKNGYQTGICNAYLTIGFAYSIQEKNKMAYEYWQKALALSQKTGYKKGLANSYGNLGILFINNKDLTRAMEYQLKGLEIREEIGDKKAIATSYTNIGNIYLTEGNYNKAIHNYNKAFETSEKVGDIINMAGSYNNIGSIYRNQGNYAMALEYFNKSLKIGEQNNIKNLMAISSINIGMIYYYQRNYQTAVIYYSEALKIDEEIGNQIRQLISLEKLSAIFKYFGDSALATGNAAGQKNNHLKALEYFYKARELYNQLGMKNELAVVVINIGVINGVLNDPDAALDHYFKAVKIYEELSNSTDETTAKTGKKGAALSYNYIADFYAKQGDFTKSKEYYKKAVLIEAELKNK